MGRFTVRDLGLSERLLRQVRDRMLIDVYRRDLVKVEATGAPVPATRGDSGVKPELRLVRHQPQLDQLQKSGAIRAGRPEARGFRADVLPPFSGRGPNVPAALEPRWIAAADIVGRRLTSDGLLRTLAAVVREVGHETFVAQTAAGVARLKDVGFPADLLECFEHDGVRGEEALVRLIASRIGAGLDDGAAVAGVSFDAVRPGPFRAADEGGTQPITMVRLQVPSRTMWEPAEAGDLLDAAASMMSRCEGARALVSVNRADLKAMLARLEARPLGVSDLTVVEEALPVAQWAQDTGKAGFIASNEGLSAATLIPRYASQNEDGSVFVPNESYMAGGWAAAGHAVVQSRLLFQGGGVMCVQSKNERVLLVGEAEVERNTALGLTRDQVEALFAGEFGVDRCVPLPVASFHLDLDLTVRTGGVDGPVVFVNDEFACAGKILRLGVGAMRSGGLLDDAQAGAAVAAIERGDARSFDAVVRPVLEAKVGPDGSIGAAAGAAFSAGAGDDGRANLRRFIAAADVLSARAGATTEDPVRAAYFGALRRVSADREALRGAIAALGWRVEALPGMSAGGDSLGCINGVHDKNKYFAPVCGGLYAPLEEEALTIIRRVLGDEVSVVPVPGAALQRRAGGLHCVAVAYRRAE